MLFTCIYAKECLQHSVSNISVNLSPICAAESQPRAPALSAEAGRATSDVVTGHQLSQKHAGLAKDQKEP